MPAEAVLAALRALLQALAPLRVPVALAGGLALAVWKHPRFTKDVDVLLALEGIEQGEMLDALRRENFIPKSGEEPVTLGDFKILQLRYEPPQALVDVQVDLLIVESHYQRQALERRTAVAIPELGMEVHALTCEDLLIHKLIAGRIIDLADAAALFRANRQSLDYNYLLRWIAERALTGDFQRVWEEAFPGEAAPSAPA